MTNGIVFESKRRKEVSEISQSEKVSLFEFATVVDKNQFDSDRPRFSLKNLIMHLLDDLTRTNLMYQGKENRFGLSKKISQQK